MARDKGAFVHPPETFALGEFGQVVDLHRGKPEEFAGRLSFVERFVVENPGGRVSKESLRKASGLGAEVADGVAIGQAVDDPEVRESPGSGEFPVGLHTGEKGG